MATKIQLRRDTSDNWAGTNPILAQGEPGVELDTKKMKVGDGIQSWNDLDYVASGTSENSTTNMFVKIDGLDNNIGPNAAGVISVSTDGLNWTPSVYNQLFTDWEAWDIFHLAVGNGRIVYHTYEYGSSVDGLRWAYNPFDKPNRPASDESRMGPNGEEVNWKNIRYVGEKFIAVGYYYDDARNDDYYYPIAAYSTDGDSWTRININLDYCHTLIGDERSVTGSGVNGLMMEDVAYGDNGWLFVTHWGPSDTTGGGGNYAKAFYVTDLAAQLGSANAVSGIPGAYTVKYDGKGWVTWSNYDAPTGNSSILYINSSSDPRTGSWVQVDMDTVAMSLTGVDVGSITDVVAGTVNNEHWMMVGTDYHGAFASNDQGATWRFLQTGARSANIYSVSSTNPAYITDWTGNLSYDNVEKVTIAGSNKTQLNGTFYTRYYNGPNGQKRYLYSAYDPNTDTFSSPLDSTSWGGVVEVHITGDVIYGFNTFIASNTTNLRVGMVAEGYDGFTTLEENNIMSDPNVITAIDGNKVTMKYPWHFNNDNVDLYFRPVLYNTRGDGITSMAYGDGAFIGFSSNDGSRAYRTTDVTNWTKTTLGNEAQYGPWGVNYLNSVAYGAVTTPASTLINNSETIPGFASYLTVGDTFQVRVTSGDPLWTDSALAEGWSTGGLIVDPALSQWQIGVIQDVEGFNSTNYLGISTYRENNTWYGNDRHDSIRVGTSEGSTWEFVDGEGYFNTQNLNVEGYNNGYIWTTWGEITINAPFDGYYGNGNGEGYAQLTWGDIINSVRVDWYGTQIDTEGFAWHFGSEGYIWTDDGDGVIQSPGYWAIGDYDDYDSHTYIGATDNIASDAYDITVVADDTYWYFNRTGTFQLPPGGDIVDDDGYSVLDKFIPQNAVSANGDYTLIITDSGKHIYKTGTGGIKIPTNATVAFPIGTCITLVTGSTNSTTISAVDGATTTLILSKFGSDASINVPVDTYVTILKIETNKWMIQT
jgi:hypothetical protein